MRLLNSLDTPTDVAGRVLYCAMIAFRETVEQKKADKDVGLA